MRALEQGMRGRTRVVTGSPPRGAPFVVWGHRWLAERIVPRAIDDGTPWWLVDNGFFQTANGTAHGYYSITPGLAPVLLPDPDESRNPITFAPWREASAGYVLAALPGEHYGKMAGYDMRDWSAKLVGRIGRHTARQIRIRSKDSPAPLARDLDGAAVMVTHSSKAAVAAVIAGVPAIVAPTNPAAPVCGTRLSEIETPPRPDRRHWWASLMSQQWTLAEMAAGACRARLAP